ncbi:VIT1/CCC1 transporter family protein [Acidipropionibacterium timonense]|uniref:VIT1/CCC1 transporter family protein n=1 Tax=Acidipropionibacterium timonense TaxID=2161818 RepID=UPI0010326FD8|nr:VIT family protein [Acidipropionibacterium timonense]
MTSSDGTTANDTGEADSTDGLGDRLNWLRAGVLGANDGIVSTAGLVVGVAAVQPQNTHLILLTAMAGILAASVSMALGEYVSVSTQRDVQRSLVAMERTALRNHPRHELAKLTDHYRDLGLSPATAAQVARELTHRDALGTHLRTDYDFDPGQIPSAWHAAGASALSFVCGALIPTLAMVFTPGRGRIGATFVAVLVALATTGWVSSTLGRSPRRPAMARVVAGGALAMAITWGVGRLFGVSG